MKIQNFRKVRKLAIPVTLLAAWAVAAPAIAHSPAPVGDRPAAESSPEIPDITPILRSLPQPDGAPPAPEAHFSANSYGQQGLNFRLDAAPAELLEFYRQALTERGYQERAINTSSGPWGFSVVFVPPEPLGLVPTRSARTPALQIGESLTVYDSGEPGVFLVIQAAALSPTEMNVNLRFEEL